MNKSKLKNFFSGKVSFMLSLILVFVMFSNFTLNVQAKHKNVEAPEKNSEYVIDENDKAFLNKLNSSLVDFFEKLEKNPGIIIKIIFHLFVVVVLIITFSNRKKNKKRLNEFLEVFADDIKKKKKTELIASDRILSQSTAKYLDDIIQAINEHFESDEDEIKRQKKELDGRKRVETDKQDFLASAAHELKSPLQVIQGSAEVLKYGIAKGGRARQKYCDTIIEESKNMNNLVLEILDVTKYRQNMYGEVKEEPFSINKFVQGELNKLEPTFKEKGIEAENVVDKHFMGYSDIDKISHVLKNYLNNAMCHVNLYKKIVISCEERANCFRISVFNSGDHIPEEAMKNIWNSFYRVDKSRNRKQGRYGLGLSIVETIQTTLGNDFGVENVYGGVQFWFDVKKAGK